jgi:hypothetical protein
MSGTSSHIVLEKEDGVYSITVNYDSNHLPLFFYLLYNKRKNWENIISRGNASSIGTSLDYTEQNTLYARHFSDFYLERKGFEYNEEEKAIQHKSLSDFCSEVSIQSFTFFMDKDNNIFVSTQYHVEDSEYINDFQHHKNNLIPLEKYINKHYTEKEINKKILEIKAKVFKSVTKIIECNSIEEKEDWKKKVKLYHSDNYTLVEDPNSHNLILIFLNYKEPFYSKY